MSTFKPGRIYSGIIHGKRRQIIFRDDLHWHWIDDGDLMGADAEGSKVTDVRGPLVVLDDPHTPMNAVALALREAGFDYLAHQIEEQTRPPLQDGWHEVEHSHDWIGRTVRELRDGEWHTVPGHRDATQDWTSTHYIGPGSGDAS